jgi:hypothetical protein
LEAREPAPEKISTGDWVLFCLAGAMALAFFIIERTPINVAIVLVGMFGLLVRPALHISWVARASGKAKTVRRATSVLITFFVVSGFGYLQWPKPTKRHLSTMQMRTLANMLEEETKTRVEIAAVANDNEAYDLAEQLVAAFTEAGLIVTPAVPPTIIAAGPIEDVTVGYLTVDDKTHITIEKALNRVGIKATSKYDKSTTSLGHVQIFVSIGKFENK